MIAEKIINELVDKCKKGICEEYAFSPGISKKDIEDYIDKNFAYIADGENEHGCRYKIYSDGIRHITIIVHYWANSDLVSISALKGYVDW